MSCTSCILLWVTAGFTALYFIFKLYCKLTTGWCKSYVSLVGKTTIVTGANTGIGYYNALDFAKRGARVILACRNKEKALEAQRKIIEATNNKNVIVKLLDLASFKSVREFAKDINETEDRIDILVNNAGHAGHPDVTSDGISVTMQANYFSHFLLTHLLLPKLKKSTPSRIVNVSSLVAKWGEINIDKITEPTHEMKLYSNSKLAQVYFTQELAKKLQGTGVTVYAVHPGSVQTEFLRDVKFPLSLITPILTNWFFKTSEEGAQTQLHVSLTKGIEHLSGEFFSDCEHLPPYPSARNEGLGKKLWEKSEQVVKLQPEETL